MYGTCAYHALTFLDLATVCEYIWSMDHLVPGDQILNPYRKHLDLGFIWSLVKIYKMPRPDAIVHVYVKHMQIFPTWISEQSPQSTDLTRYPNNQYLPDLIAVDHVKTMLGECRSELNLECRPQDSVVGNLLHWAHRQSSLSEGRELYSTGSSLLQ